MIDFLEEAQSLFDYTQRMRRDFHRHPELGFQEVRTAGIVARELNQLGLEVSTGIAETGVIALIEGASPGSVAMLRFDMDALPITEASDAEYASQNPGVMHACGHDGHTAIGLTVARLLNDHRDQLAGTVKLVFQPAEEGLGGAERMIAEGALHTPRPDVSLGVHLWNERPYGWIGVTPGPVMAAAEVFQVRIEGRGGHGAIPQQTVDPVVAAAQIISALQTIVSRNVSPLETAVVSVAMLRAGETFNVIPAQAVLQGTIRTYHPQVRATVLQRFTEIVEGVASAMGCQSSIDLQSLTPALVNQQQTTAVMQSVARQMLPQDHLDANHRTMGSEDMAFFMQEVPGCFIFVGSANPEKGLDAAHHHPRFDFDERALPKAAALLASTTLELLNSPRAEDKK